MEIKFTHTFRNAQRRQSPEKYDMAMSRFIVETGAGINSLVSRNAEVDVEITIRPKQSTQVDERSLADFAELPFGDPAK